MREALGKDYQKPTLEYFCDALIREQDNLVQLGVINTTGDLKMKKKTCNLENICK
jgi:hypothetical protein